MKKIMTYGIVLILGVALGIGSGYMAFHQSVYEPFLYIVGDVEETLTLENLSEYDKVSFEYKGEKMEGVPMNDILATVQMTDENSNIFYVGSDGLTAEVDGQTLEESYLLFTAENGWEMINLNHPVSSNIKRLADIVVVSQEEITDGSFTIFTEEENLFSVTPGQMYVDDYNYFRDLEGESNINENFVRIYTSYKIYDMKSLIEEQGEAYAEYTIGTLFMEDGSITQVALDGFLEMNGNQLNYISYEEAYAYQDVVGLYLGEALGYVGDAYYDMEYYLEKGEDILVIFLDGFNYNTYETALAEGIIPNIGSGEVHKSFSVHTSVTNAGFASMITGQTPDVNGVHSRDERAFMCRSIFGVASELGVSIAFLEGDAQILDTEISPKLHVNGDLEILESVQEAVDDGTQFIFAHLHELDDTGHSYGPDDDLIYEYLAEIDSVIGEILDDYDGKVLFTTDHGMHTDGDGGNHGSMRYEDMIIPIITLYE